MRAATISSAKQHAEWLSLVQVSGPFLTLSVLNKSFKFGLDSHQPETYRAVKEAYEEWESSDSPAIHNAWVRFLLTTVLGYPEECIGEAQAIPESAVAVLDLQGERIRPNLAILDPDDPRQVQFPILVYPRKQKLDSPTEGSSWAASPHTRMQVLLQNTSRQAGFVTNGAQWSLVHVRKQEPTGFITWETMLLTEEKLLLQAFQAILGVERTLGSPQGEALTDLLDESSKDQEEVTKELGRQVRQAVEVLIGALDRIDQDSGRQLLACEDPKTVYNAALTVMMRLIFLLCAEERGLMDVRDLYVQHYSVGDLSEQLRESASGDEQVLEHRHDAWKRLLATFRLVHGGCQHEDINLPAYGGSLFDPTRYPFLEQAQIDNRVTLHLLDSLQFLQIRVPGGGRETRKLSFRALGVEQIGHVYEGLLDHTAARATEVMVTLGPFGDAEIYAPLSEIYTAVESESTEKYFKERGAKVPRVRLIPDAPHLKSSLHSLARLNATEDERSMARAILGLVKIDDLGNPMVHPIGSTFVTAGTDRRSSGTHYTPLSLTEEVVQYALEPVVYVGPTEGLPRTEWKLKSARELVDLKVCDMAMGSGAFLVQACRYLSERLVEAWQESLAKVGRPLGFSPEGAYFTHPIPDDHRSKGPGALATTPIGNLAIADPSSELISSDLDERLAQARRIVADKCLYGVDINPMAVEMAKLSLWLTTMQRDRPFTFLDHALRTGDSLLGVSDRQLETFNMNPDGQYGDLLLPWVRESVESARAMRDQISKIPSHDPEAIRRKSEILEKSARTIERAQLAAGLLVAEELAGRAASSFDEAALERLEATLTAFLPSNPNRDHLETLTVFPGGTGDWNVRLFHWQLEFPDVFAQGGFDAIVGNPPFMGGQKITGALGTDYRDFLVKHIAGEKRGSADLCAYFFLRASALVKEGGTFGLIATNTISQGDTREVGLDQLVDNGRSIYRAFKSSKWPGDANLEIAKVWLRNGSWPGLRSLDGLEASNIGPFLDDGSSSGKPFRLKVNQGLSFQGSIVLGMGFIMSPEAAQELIDHDPRNKDALFPYLNGEDLNSRSDQSPSRWVINFFDWPLGRIGQALPFSGETVAQAVQLANPRRFDDCPCDESSRWHPEALEPIPEPLAKRREKWLQLGIVPRDYPGRVAADFPHCLKIVEQLVRPERNRNNREVYRLRWWQYAEKRPELYARLKSLARCLVRARVSQYHAFAWISPAIVGSEQLVFIAFDCDALFAATQSSIHLAWLEQNASSMRTDIRYTPSDCFETFPLPTLTKDLEAIGGSFESLRRNLCQQFGVGLTSLAKITHDPMRDDPDTIGLREHLVALDYAVRDAYGWQDLTLAHGFCFDGLESRFNISQPARHEILRRLLKLNNERYAEEVAAGLHDKQAAKAAKAAKKTAKSKSNGQESPFGPRRNLFDDQRIFGEEDAT